MPEINVLPREVYQLIAAGEVVERPSSIVKEMIENSIDAGAANITLEIKNGGSTYIRITDDGCGIERDQVKKVFVSHATSKIKISDDLDSIATLGFRGEAMASIAAVARVELLTRSEHEELGTRYEIAGGEEIDFGDAGCPKGTTVVVRDIFFNTPARMKFLKKDVTEGNAVAGVVDRMAISHPNISFRFIRDGKQVLVTSGNGDLRDAVYSVLGRDFATSLVDVDYSVNNMRVTGFVTKPSAGRKSRAMQYFFINSRLVKSQTIMAALEQAFRNSIMVGHFPGCVLNIECDSSFVDVNVHPAKIEVRFANEKPVFELVYYGVKNAIDMGDTPKEAVITQKPMQTTVNGRLDFITGNEDKPAQMEFRQRVNPDNFWRVAAPTPEYKISTDTQPVADAPSPPAPEPEPTPVDTVTESPAPQPPEDIIIPDFRLVGQAFNTYIIIEMDNDIYFIDKHAAHERINFERLRSNAISSQVLLEPVSVRLTPEEYTVVCDSLDLYAQCGFAVEDFGSDTVIVRECPSLLNGQDVKALIYETAAQLLDGRTEIIPDKLDWILHSTACRSAVKAGDTTTPQEQELFVKRLLAMPDIRYCPHGRPVMIKMTRYEIEKQFGRIQ